MNKKTEAFTEEQKNLITIENDIDTLISSFENEIVLIHKNVNELWQMVSDDDTVAERKMLMEKQWQLNQNIENGKQLKSSPYFARMDFDFYDPDETGETQESYFIGYHDIYNINNKRIVMDWRNPVGSFYTQKNETTFQHDRYIYTLLLRRALRIKDERLISCTTEYEAGEQKLTGDVVDPFLIQVLKDKRRQIRLTNIIVSIQEKQNSIIRKPIAESFVVQGCAGSGKTMILLHRLSVLLYNNRNYPLSNIVIITPNKLFDANIDELSKELGLAEIPRYTVDEYYNRLINMFLRSNMPVGVINSERSIDERILMNIYSTDYATAMEKQYNKYWEYMINKLFQSGYRIVLSRGNVLCPTITEYNINTYTMLDMALTNAVRKIEYDIERRETIGDLLAPLRTKAGDIIEKLSQTDKEYSDAKNELKALLETNKKQYRDLFEQKKSEIREIEAEVNRVEKEIALVKDKKEKVQEKSDYINARMTEYLAYDFQGNQVVDELTEQIRESTLDIVSQIRQLQVEYNDIRKEHDSYEKRNLSFVEERKIKLKDINANRLEYLDYDRLKSFAANDTIAEQIRKSKYVIRILELEARYRNLPGISFARRNQIKKEIIDAKATYRIGVSVLIKEIETKLYEEIDQIDQVTESYRQRMQLINDDISKKKMNYQQIAERIIDKSLLRIEIELEKVNEELDDEQRTLKELCEKSGTCGFESNKYESIFKAYEYASEEVDENGYISLGKAVYNPIDDLKDNIVNLDILWQNLQNCRKELIALQKKIEPLEEEWGKIGISSVSDEYINKLMCEIECCRGIIDELSFDSVVKKVEKKMIKQVYMTYDVKYTDQPYRHTLYLRLLTCSLYCRQMSVPERFINIDEAQDLSIGEYKLLSKILGPKCIYNLYGDINQVVYSYKGINNWILDVPFIINTNVCYLNENYRNSIPITDYCNNTFQDIQMIPIGISGEPVSEKTFSEAMQWIENIGRLRPETRAVIIYRNATRCVEERLREYWIGKNVAWNEISNEKISIITVEQAKGLEFETVVSITSQMTTNERYISYTRALDHLCIVNDSFSSDPVNEVKDKQIDINDLFEQDFCIKNQ